MMPFRFKALTTGKVKTFLDLVLRNQGYVHTIPGKCSGRSAMTYYLRHKNRILRYLGGITLIYLSDFNKIDTNDLYLMKFWKVFIFFKILKFRGSYKSPLG